MSQSTVGRIFHSLGFKSFFQQPKEKLNYKQKEYRVEFATKIRYSHVNNNYYLLSWCFSDEPMIYLDLYRKKVRYIQLFACEDLNTVDLF